MEGPKTTDENSNPFVLIALLAGLASTAIAIFPLLVLHTITDAGMRAIAAMVARRPQWGSALPTFASSQRPPQ